LARSRLGPYLRPTHQMMAYDKGGWSTYPQPRCSGYYYAKPARAWSDLRLLFQVLWLPPRPSAGVTEFSDTACEQLVGVHEGLRA
jgi:hypothetical protein